jgi:hypothetical protein
VRIQASNGLASHPVIKDSKRQVRSQSKSARGLSNILDDARACEPDDISLKRILLGLASLSMVGCHNLSALTRKEINLDCRFSAQATMPIRRPLHPA